MSFVNEKGGYTKVLEITRENSNRSVTMLKEDFLTKSENYILNVTDFVTSTSPPLNEIDEPYFRIMPKGAHNETIAQAELRLPVFLDNVNVREFRPTNYRTWMELARQMNDWFAKLTDLFKYGTNASGKNDDGDDFVVFYLTSEGKLRIKLSPDFTSLDVFWDNENTTNGKPNYLGLYIQVGEKTQSVLDIPKYIFQVNDGNNTHLSDIDGEDNLIAEDNNGILRFSQNQEASLDILVRFSKKPISNFDQRLSIDIYSTFPLKSKILTENGKEEHEHILFRLPFDEQHSFQTKMSYSQISNQIPNGMGSNIEEDVDIGLTNLCDKHPTVLHQLLLGGIIRSVQLKIMIRYIDKENIFERDIDFANGFWYLRLLFVKKV